MKMLKRINNLFDNRMLKDTQADSDVLLFIGYILAIVLIFMVCISYFIFIPSVAIVLTEMSNQTIDAGVHDITDVNNRVLWSIRMAHFIVIVGVLLFVGILRSTRHEYESF